MIENDSVTAHSFTVAVSIYFNGVCMNVPPRCLQENIVVDKKTQAVHAKQVYFQHFFNILKLIYTVKPRENAPIKIVLVKATIQKYNVHKVHLLIERINYVTLC